MTKSTTRSTPGAPLPPPGERRRLRETGFLTEEDVAATLGVTRATVRSWETGRTSPRGRKREAYAEFLAALDAGEDRGTPSADDGPAATAPEETAAPASDGTAASATADPPAPDRPTERTSARTRSAPPSRDQPPTANTRPRPAAKRAAKPPLALHNRPVPRPGPAPDADTDADTDAETGGEGQGEGAAGEGHRTSAVADTTTAFHRAVSPEEAFDVLYASVAPDLVRQAYLLTGRRRLSEEAVERAFHLAWQRWPEVAVDSDPAGWVRAVAHEYALSPWIRLRAAHRYPDEPPAEESRRELLEALQVLPTVYRRALLLYDCLGLGLPETAAETEASTPATANRVIHAREALAERIPELADADVLRDRLRALASAGASPLMTPPSAVRKGCERRARTWTRAVVAVSALIMAATAFTWVTAPRQYRPPMSPAQQVEGVPLPQYGPPRLTDEARKLHHKLRSEPAGGPERLVLLPY